MAIEEQCHCYGYVSRWRLDHCSNAGRESERHAGHTIWRIRTRGDEHHDDPYVVVLGASQCEGAYRCHTSCHLVSHVVCALAPPLTTLYSFIEPRALSPAVRAFHNPRASKGSRKGVHSTAKDTKTSATSTSQKPSPTGVAAAVNDSCKTQITPECLQSIYNIPSAPASSNRSNLFVASFAGESAAPLDFKVYI